MNTMYKTITILFLGVFSFYSLAQDSVPFTIEEAKSYALENNIELKNSVYDIEIARQQIIETRGVGLPQVEINGQFSNFINLPVQVVGANFINPNAPAGETISFEAGTKYTANGTLQVSQMVFNGSYIIGLKAANFFAEFQKTATRATKEEIVFNVIQSYELASVAKKNKLFIDSLVITTQELVDKQQHYLDLGLIVQEDLDQLNYSLLVAESSKLVADINFENAVNMLKLSMGFPIENSIEIVDTPEVLMGKKSISTGNDIYQNINYSMLEQQVQLSVLNVKNTKMANLPSLNAFFQHTYNAYRNEFNFFADEKWHPQTLWGLNLNIPIFSGLTRHSKTQQAKIKLKKDENSLAQLEQSLKLQELQFKNNLRGAENKLLLQEKNVELAKTIYENEIIKEEIGAGNNIIITQKHNQLMSAQSQYIGSMIELFQSKLSLDKLYNNILPKN